MSSLGSGLGLADPREDRRALRGQWIKTHDGNVKNGTHNAETTIFDSTMLTTDTASGTPGQYSGPGNVELINLCIDSTSTFQNSVMIDAYLSIYLDGEGTASIKVPIGHFLSSYANTNASITTGGFTYFASDHIGVDWNVLSAGVGGFRRIFIPWNSSLKITYHNSSSTQDAYLFSEVLYRNGPIPTWKGGPGTRKAKLRYAMIGTPASPNVTVAYQTEQDIINVSTVRGEVESVGMFILNSVNSTITYEEGHVKFYIDGTNIHEWGGTEDFFGGHEGFAGGAFTRRSADVGCTYHGGWSGGLFGTQGYRMFGKAPGDTMPFDSNLRITWTNGETNPNFASSQTVYFFAYCFYYLER